MKIYSWMLKTLLKVHQSITSGKCIQTHVQPHFRMTILNKGSDFRFSQFQRGVEEVHRGKLLYENQRLVISLAFISKISLQRITSIELMVSAYYYTTGSRNKGLEFTIYWFTHPPSFSNNFEPLLDSRHFIKPRNVIANSFNEIH